uniref:Reverse transcriptase domain-containing protein n=1 Tax=Globodera pallida TaxID=36090 RepID=A0A183CTV9_GLOPA
LKQFLKSIPTPLKLTTKMLENFQ